MWQGLNGDQCVHSRVMKAGHAHTGACTERGKLGGFGRITLFTITQSHNLKCRLRLCVVVQRE